MRHDIRALATGFAAHAYGAPACYWLCPLPYSKPFREVRAACRQVLVLRRGFSERDVWHWPHMPHARWQHVWAGLLITDRSYILQRAQVVQGADLI